MSVYLCAHRILKKQDLTRTFANSFFYTGVAVYFASFIFWVGGWWWGREYDRLVSPKRNKIDSVKCPTPSLISHS